VKRREFITLLGGAAKHRKLDKSNDATRLPPSAWAEASMSLSI
jgi:hypothetical protein